MSSLFKTTILDHYLRKKRRENEKIRQETLYKVLRLLPQLSDKYGFTRAYLFGSLAQKGHFRQRSDIDIAIQGLTNEKYFALIAELSEVLDRNVDVVQIEKHHFKKRIVETGIEWKKKS